MSFLVNLLVAFLLSVGYLNTGTSLTVTPPAADRQLHAPPDDEPITIRGHVKTTGGQAIANASVTLTRNGHSQPTHSDVTDSNGDYDWVEAVWPGSYELKISKTGYVTRTADVTAGLVDIERTDTLIAQ